MRLQDLIFHLQHQQMVYGPNTDVVLWDLDTGRYFELHVQNIEVQEDNGLKRLSIGVNDYCDPPARQPTRRPA